MLRVELRPRAAPATLEVFALRGRAPDAQPISALLRRDERDVARAGAHHRFAHGQLRADVALPV